MKKLLPLLIIALISKVSFAQEVKINLNEMEVKEEIARSLNLNAQQIDVYPKNIEYAKDDSINEYGVNIKGRVFITWGVRDIVGADETFNYKKGGLSYQSEASLDDTKSGDIISSVKIGYQLVEHLRVDGSFEKSSSEMGLTSITGNKSLGSMAGVPSTSVKNDFQTIKIGLSTNLNLIDAKTWRMDLIAGGNAGMVMMNSTYKSNSDVYNSAIGYTYGGEAGVRVLHKSGLYVEAGAGMNKKTLAPKTFNDGSSMSFNGNEKYVFINVGYSFSGKKKR